MRLTRFQHYDSASRKRSPANYSVVRAVQQESWLAVGLSMVTNLHKEDSQLAVLNAADDSAIAYAVFPELTPLGTLVGFANAARVIT